MNKASSATQTTTALKIGSTSYTDKRVYRNTKDSYPIGIYAGTAQHWATIRFSVQAAAWVSCEQWHPAQSGRWLPDGSALRTDVSATLFLSDPDEYEGGELIGFAKVTRDMTERRDHVRGPLRMSGFTGMTPPCFSLMARATSGGM